MITFQKWMCVVCILFLSACVHYESMPPLVESVGDADILIENVRIFDGEASNTVLDNMDVWVKEGKIETILPHTENPGYPSGLTVIEGQGLTLMPGLIDFHVHIGGTEAPPWRPTFYNPEHSLQGYLNFGVTTVVDLGGIPELLKKTQQHLDQGEWLGPRLYYAGRQITVAESHPGPLIDTSLPWPLNNLVKSYMVDEVDTSSDFSGLMQTRLDEGVSLVKIMIDHIPLDSPAMSADVARSVVKAAHARDLPVAAHIGSIDDLKTALHAGVDLLAHSVSQSELDQETLKSLSLSNVTQISTLRVFANIAAVSRGQNPVQTFDAEIMAEGVVEAFDLGGSVEPEMEAYGHLIADHTNDMFESCRLARQQGIPTILGTDSPLFGSPAGSSAYYELQLLVDECGYTPKQALEAATGRPGKLIERYWGLKGAGRVVPGAPADLILLSGAPLENLADMHQVQHIISRGRLIQRLGRD